ncbi:MAG: hypothetical protein AMQ74_00162 [Candidatus Methanofastidiosum methylothiophilum]|uniref:GIY-YIG domain-containing protein n=1 Tax=Candidatus Methanofastidiosum methylothiophilum TaxID=1705564 RepID=A0A150JA42_9EURY|nr:MAG: hypothetical protein AMQ74_00162 [Candidatus Methanofastidiosum methylthiophilus]NMC77283.1 GIY-YIG nuclease family protein [Candidatus Methanofastidiosa archaeon]
MKKGTYSLIIFLKDSREINIGKLGKFFFKRGYYVYNGSALGGFGRVKYHLKENKINRWHIDYFLEKASIVKIILAEVKENYEHEITYRLLKKDNAEIIVKGFGSSDCNRCLSHLIYFNESPKIEEVYQELCLNYKVLKTTDFKDMQTFKI